MKIPHRNLLELMVTPMHAHLILMHWLKRASALPRFFKLAGKIHQGAFYQFKYNITPLLKFGKSNLLEVEVSKQSENRSFLSNGIITWAL